MQITKLKNAGKNGWYIGNFDAAVVKSTTVEVCYNKIKKGHTDPHYHTKCTEVILVIRGKGIIKGKKVKKGNIIVIKQGEINDLVAITKKFTVVGVKIPAGGSDKVRI
jgi:uncharacterized protein YjlB|tara:strand:- start:638 stop:961 length:324 start_codon:yes stop_codon:yes gene_type:complete